MGSVGEIVVNGCAWDAGGCKGCVGAEGLQGSIKDVASG